jgi:hypothetical protein
MNLATNTPNFTPLNLPDLAFAINTAITYSIPASAIFKFNISSFIVCNSFTISDCKLILMGKNIYNWIKVDANIVKLSVYSIPSS